MATNGVRRTRAKMPPLEEAEVVDLTMSPPRSKSPSASNCSSAMLTPQEREWEGAGTGTGEAQA